MPCVCLADAEICVGMDGRGLKVGLLPVKFKAVFIGEALGREMKVRDL